MTGNKEPTHHKYTTHKYDLNTRACDNSATNQSTRKGTWGQGHTRRDQTKQKNVETRRHRNAVNATKEIPNTTRTQTRTPSALGISHQVVRDFGKEVRGSVGSANRYVSKLAKIKESLPKEDGDPTAVALRKQAKKALLEMENCRKNLILLQSRSDLTESNFQKAMNEFDTCVANVSTVIKQSKGFI